jgi:hypothetical protein
MTTQTNVQHDTNHLDSITTTAGKIRYLATIYVDQEGKVNRGRIAKILDIKYQWVRNVLITPIKG